MGDSRNVRDSRDAESAILDRCVVVALAKIGPQSAQDQREANIFRIAAMVIEPRGGPTVESKRLADASEQYCAVHPTVKLDPGEVVRKGWIVCLPRLRDKLKHRLELEKNMVMCSCQSYRK